MEKIILFLLTVLVFTLAGVIFINPKGVDKVQTGSAPIFEFRDYTFYNIDEKGVDEFLVSSEGYHYDRMDVLREITYYKKHDESIDILESDTANIYRDYTDFNGSVVYTKDGRYKLISKDVRYNKGNDTIAGGQPFVMRSESGEMNGSSFFIDIKKHILKAEKIRTVYTNESAEENH